MRSGNEKLNTARAVGSSGCDFLEDGQLVYATQWPLNTSTGWYGFVVNAEAVITDVVFVDREGNELALTPTWEDETLAAGAFISAGFIAGEDAYISDITCTGSIILYLD